MKTFPRTIVLVVVCISLVIMSRPVLGITPYDDVLVQQSIKNLQQENYDEAVADLTEAWQKGTHTAQKAFLLGQAYRLLLNYPKAKQYLEEALRLQPAFPQAQLMLADTLLALERPQDAMPILKAMEASGYEPGQTAFLLGMAATKQGKPSEALDYFRKAEQDPRMAQEAKFQASLALTALNRLKEARKALEESISIDTQSQTADFAKRYMGLVDKRLEDIRPFRAGVSFGFDYDSNVTLQAGGTGAPTVTAGKGDIVYTQMANLEYTLRAGQPLSIAASYAYYENFHRRIPTYDMLSHLVTVTPTYNYRSGRFWFPFSYNYADVQSDKYYVGYLLNPTLLHLFSENVAMEVGTRLNRRYYWGFFLSEDDRSGINYGGSLGLYYFFKKQKGFLLARGSIEHDATAGSNWDNSTFRMLLSVLYPATDKLKFNVFLDMYLQPYDHVYYSGQTVGNVAGAPLIPQPKRYDQVLITGVQANYEIIKNLEVNVHYFFTRDQCNINIYNYSRHIVGCQLGYRY